MEAGFATPSEESFSKTLSLDDYLIENKQASFLLRVKGTSMIEAGICERDLVIVERGREARPGDIVIAEIDGGWTMKYYRTGSRGPYLEAASSEYPLIYPEGELKIVAVVRAVVRKY